MDFSVTIDLGPACRPVFDRPDLALGFLKMMYAEIMPEVWLALVRAVEPDKIEAAFKLISACGGWGA